MTSLQSNYEQKTFKYSMFGVHSEKPASPYRVAADVPDFTNLFDGHFVAV
jgi:hypothetical protein